jgi:Cd2+/Zn2+-exporting ATPase
VIRRVFEIHDMHCTMCSLTIDGVLEDLAGVAEANTSYAHGRTEITYDPAAVTEEHLLDVLRRAGYHATPLTR